ncbi:MAG TPA: Hsp20/alpha crystallin family protein [Phycisphaerales bacterium]|nr:Hsp20/alpha crystallin family protein [Phycisphaerales bacterium]
MLALRNHGMLSPTHPAAAFDELLGSLFSGMPGPIVGPQFPAMNAWADEHSVYVEAELPGFSLEDVEVTFQGGQLTISGERTDKAHEGIAFHRRERTVRRFTRTLTLGDLIDADKISATLEDGVLTVTLPKAEAAKPRKVRVSAGPRSAPAAGAPEPGAA